MESTQNYELRTYGDGSFGVGQEVVPNVFFFAWGNYGLTKEDATKKLKNLRGGKRDR
jgi:hypothetical protein